MTADPATPGAPGTSASVAPHAAGSGPATDAAASLAARVLRHGRYEALAMLRNGEQLVLAIVLPLLALVALVITPLLDGFGPSRIDVAAPGVLALCTMSTAFTGQGIATGFDRRYGVLRFLSTTPLGRSGLILGKAVAVAGVLGVQLVVIGGTAVLLGWEPRTVGIPGAALLLLVGSAAFTALGLLVAGTLRPEATLAVTNLVWILLAAAGGVILPASALPAAVEPFVAVLPSAALGDGLRSALVDGSLDPVACLVLLAWATVASLAAIRWFKWS
ncbi:ABC transporter permease [Arthrobacter agilis]|uniref:ABC transporter permease n=1 Tax=Arthrobacter agilis TaxID=37921 RepID=UPI000B35919B|nr:ABC transporter permease [Arthrobacter agilis]OUM44522.1 ABC transporter [Arthrobacter agilis]PPB47427.1 ABC transporter [Arthrobacter agilis]TPV22781.1 ABC transporter permease [Arthrobacter agilis]VDR32029.1 ABC transporter efflux protein, DrrB family [Arthrobacter agilis]